MKRPLILLLTLALAAPALVQASEYRTQRAGHPLRIAAYLLHPVGYLIDRLVFYPAWYIGQSEWVGPLFGVKRTVRDIVLDRERAGRHPNVLIEIAPTKPPETQRPRREEPEQP